MQVKELIIKLLDYNKEAKIDVIANNKSNEFSITFGSSEGCTKKNCDTVSFYVDSLCVSDRETKNDK